jgi:hypothetical protein
MVTGDSDDLMAEAASSSPLFVGPRGLSIARVRNPG